MMRNGILTGLLIAALAAPAAFADATGFAKLSPLPVHQGPDLAGATTGLTVKFGEAFDLLERRGEALHLRRGDGSTIWVRRSDMLISPDGRVVRSGHGFKTENRPMLRFWRSHSTLIDFLRNGNARSANADFEEVLIRRPNFDLALPLVYSDSVEAVDSRVIDIVSVMVPVYRSSVEALEGLAGGAGRTVDLTFLVDVSGDASDFSLPILTAIGETLLRQLRDEPATINVRVVHFGGNLLRGFRQAPGNDLSALTRRFTPPEDRSGTQDEPLLQAIQRNPPEADASGKRQSAAYVVLSGGDVALASTPGAKGSDLETLSLDIPADTSVIIARITPEPGQTLAQVANRMERFGKTEYLDFTPTVAADISNRIVTMVRSNDIRPLEATEKAAVCATASQQNQFCVLNFMASTHDRMPSLVPAKVSADWYAVPGWTVIDGLNLILD